MSIDHNNVGSCSKVFEELPVNGLIALKEESINKIKDYAKKIVNYHSSVKEADASYRHYAPITLGLQERYQIIANYLKKMFNNKFYIKILNTEFVLKSDAEKSLLAVLVCDSDCKYYDLYEEKRREGLSHEKALDYLQLFYGIKSPKLIQLERYYQLLNY